MGAVTFRLIGLGLLLAGLAALLAGVEAALRKREERQGWAAARGKVTAHESRSATPGNPYIFPVVEFTASDGQRMRFTAEVGQWPAAPKIGAELPVIYDPQQPQRARLDTAAERWFVPGALAGLGLIGLLLGALFLLIPTAG